MVELISEVVESLKFETYPIAPHLDGVWLNPLKKHHSENGSFLELFRMQSGQYMCPAGPLAIEQLSLVEASPGRINAFHIHPKREQDEIWVVIQGKLLVWLVDCRANSGTSGARVRVVLSSESPSQLHIPAGVAHGYMAGPVGATLIYAMNQQFDPVDPNEGRLPWDFFGSDLWQEDRG